MISKVFLVVCAQALLLQVALGQCVRPAPASATPRARGCAPAPAWPAPCSGSRLALSGTSIAPTSGGALPVSSFSALAPVGLSVASENVFEGLLNAAGQLPFVGTVGLQGVLPTAGAGVVNHACGDGSIGMISDGPGSGYGPASGAYGIAGGAYGLTGGAYGPARAAFTAGAAGLNNGARSCGRALY